MNERSVIGSILLDSNAIKEVAHILSVEDFEDKDLGEIYGAAKALYEGGKPVDIVTVHSETKALDPTDLAELQNMVPTASHARHYAEIVKRKSTVRKIKSMGEFLLKHKGSDEAMIGDAVKLIDKIQKDNFVEPKKTMMQLHDAYEAEEELERVETGIEFIDKCTKGGIKVGKFWCLTAFSGVGKTTIIMQIMRHMLDKGKKVNFYSLEMSEGEVYNYLQRILGGMDKMDLDKVHFDWKLGFSRERYLNKILADAKMDKPDVVFIDYLQLIQLPGGLKIYDKMSEIAYKIQAFTRETGIPVVALSQVSNNDESNKTGIIQAKGGGEVYAACDVFLGIRRDFADENGRKGQPGFDTLKRPLEIFKNRQGLEGGIEIEWDYKKGLYILGKKDLQF